MANLTGLAVLDGNNGAQTLLVETDASGRFIVRHSNQGYTLTSVSVVTAAGSSQTLVGSDPSRRYLGILAPSGAPIWVNPTGGTAALNGVGCIPLPASSYLELNCTNAITAFCQTASQTINVWTG